jgi:hypothetical protein
LIQLVLTLVVMEKIFCMAPLVSQVSVVKMASGKVDG